MTHMNNFVNKNNLRVDTIDSATHVSMVGGKYMIINEENIDELRNVIRLSYVEQTPISIVECKTPVFRYFIDIDFVSNLPITEVIMISYVKKIIEYVKECFVVNKSDIDTLFTTYGYMTKPRVKVKDGVDKIKTGCHLYIPNLHIDSSCAIKVRTHIIGKILIDYPNLNWDDIIDESVYKNLGLRMPYTPKLVKCKCKSKRDCNMCIGGVINEGGIYTPAFVLNSKDLSENKEVLDHLNRNVRFSLSKATIRILNNWNIPTINYNVLPNTNQKSKRLSRIKSNVYSDGDMKCASECKEIERFIRGNFECYKSITVTNVTRHEYTDALLNKTYIYLIACDSKWCQNINKEHKSNHIYFQIKPSGVLVQKCFCTCETLVGRKDGYCKHFESPKNGINIKNDNRLYDLLFSYKREQNIIFTKKLPTDDSLMMNPESRNKELSGLRSRLENLAKSQPVIDDLDRMGDDIDF